MKTKAYTIIIAGIFCTGGLCAQTLISDFESGGVGATFVYSSLDTVLVVANPDATGLNTSDSVLLYDRINDGSTSQMWDNIVYIVPTTPVNTGTSTFLSFDGLVNISGEWFVRLWHNGAMVGGDGTWATPQQCTAGEWVNFTYGIIGVPDSQVDSISLEFGDWDGPTDSVNAATGDGYICYIDNLQFIKVDSDTTADYPEVVTIPYHAEGIEIDGNVDFAWDDIAAVAINKTAIDVHGTGVDISGTFKACWDDANVYIWLDITDDDVSVYAGTQPWNNDGFEIFTDGGAYNWVGDGNRVAAEQLQTRVNYGAADCGGNQQEIITTNDTMVWYEVPYAGGVYSEEIAIPFFVFYRPYADDDAAGYAAIATNAVEGELLGLEISLLDGEAVDTLDGLVNWSNPTGEDISYTSSEYYGRIIVSGWLCCEYPDGLSDQSNSPIINYYPNPANSFLNIDMIKLSKIEILSIDGRILRSQNAENSLTQVDISGLKTGLYLIKATNKDNQCATAKFQKYQ